MHKLNHSRWVIDVEDIPKDGLELELTLVPSHVQIETEDFAIVDPVCFSGRLEKIGREIILRGKVSTTLSLMCSRCLEAFSCSVGGQFTLNYLPEEKEEELDRELDERDLDSCYYVDHRIDLLPAIQEQIFLSIPLKPLCFANCQGLCQQCGSNLNTGHCDCQRNEIDERLLVLKQLKKGQERAKG
ncbi:MAG: DUF177 domain-containing protein [Candidatus Tectomicrobia bacterium]|uniref:DUF177 domain-containing protein n=1 Tax=Tectimicrobiota bacterium TaxID=2528274 RepID=A0A932CRR3_UNCTE|nr:DUF177 domain-containing protein [Candidatus Tectomicrobia bacterium]